MWAGARPSSPALQEWAHPRPSSGSGTVARKRVMAAAVGPPESVHEFLRSLASPHWAPCGCYLVRRRVLSQVLPRHQRQEKACISIFLVSLCFPRLLLLPVPIPWPQRGLLGPAPGPPALGLRVCGNALQPGLGRGWEESVAEERPHRWIGGSWPPSSPPHQHLPSPRILSSSPGQLLPLEPLKLFPPG